MGLVLWRVPGYDLCSKQVRYRPVPGGRLGARRGIPIRKLIETIVWHWGHATDHERAGHRDRPVQFAKGPNCGFDEWVHLAAMDRRLLPGSTLSFIPTDAHPLLQPINIEFAAWANPQSECIFLLRS